MDQENRKAKPAEFAVALVLLLSNGKTTPENLDFEPPNLFWAAQCNLGCPRFPRPKPLCPQSVSVSQGQI
jgi:hypothetical protein